MGVNSAKGGLDLYLESFALPIDREDDLLREKAAYNGGMNGYIDNPYPCGLFVQKQLYEIEFGRITIFYGGNGSGKSTLLNLMHKSWSSIVFRPLIPEKCLLLM